MGRMLDGIALDGTGKVAASRDLESRREMAPDRHELRRRIAECRHNLTKKQFLVAMQLCRPSMSLHLASKELGMDRSCLRRLFQRALTALKVSENGPPHPLS